MRGRTEDRLGGGRFFLNWILPSIAIACSIYALCAQPPKGVVDVGSTITATAGTLQCQAFHVAGPVSVLTVRCVDAGMPLHDSEYNVPASGSATYSLSRSGNTVSWTLTHGKPDSWKISANDVSRTGSF